MIEQFHFQELAGADEVAGHFDVGFRWGAFAARMIVHKDQRRRAELEEACRRAGFELLPCEPPLALSGRMSLVNAEELRACGCIDPDAEQTVRADTLAHRHALTPYEGTTLRGVVRQTWLAGRNVFDHEQVRQPA